MSSSSMFNPYLAFLMLLMTGGPSAGFERRRIAYARCYEAEPMPQMVVTNCVNEIGSGSCEVRKGSTHAIRALFYPKVNSTKVDSHIVWENGWFPISLPNQVRDGCGKTLKCPVEADTLSLLAFDLPIDSFWPQGSYPVKWTINDYATNEVIVCFKFNVLVS